MYTHPLTVKLTFSLLPEGNVTIPLNYDVFSSHGNNVAFSHHTNFSSLHDDHVSSSHDNYLPSSHVPLCAAVWSAVDCWSPQLLLHGPEKALGGCVTSCLFAC